jgi:8-oxo-dGTP diphosphatase
MSPADEIHVAAGAVVDARGATLIARRPDHAHQGGLWEFPGGKVEPGETVEGALARELHEEIGITPERLRPLIRVHFDYSGRRVLLDVWRVEAFRGRAHGREGQPVRWVLPEELVGYRFPAANRPIVTALRLPVRYLITPEPRPPFEPFLRGLERALSDGVRLVQLRAKALPRGEFLALAADCRDLCRHHRARLLLNTDPKDACALAADGVHLTAARLRALRGRPLAGDQWIGASCHTRSELEHARQVGVDFAVVAPVLATPSHPGAPVLGWTGLRALTEEALFPVYALGGMGPEHLATAYAHGAQGIAGISGLWPG